MQSDNKQLYKLTSDRTGTPEQTYKDVGNFMFQELYQSLRRPKSLIIKLKGIGFWYLRKSRMEIVLKMFPVDHNKEIDETSKLALFKHENKIEIQNIFKERLKEYEHYVQLKRETKTKRNETQVLLQPTQRED